MSTEDNLFWVLQESDIHNEEIYLPSDTPIGKVNPQRLHAILRKKHARQNQRLLFKQVRELEEYQKRFAARYKHERPTAATTAACQLIEGSDFLIEHNDMISELLSASSMINNEKDIEDLNNISKDLVLMQEPHRKQSESRIQRKHRHGFDDLDYDHYYQGQKLKEYQKQDMSIIPPEIIHASKKLSVANTLKSKHNERKKRRHLTDEEDNNKKKQKNISPMQTTAKTPSVSDRNLIPNTHTNHPTVPNRGPPTVVTSSQSNKPPFVLRSNEPPKIQATSKSKQSDHSKTNGQPISSTKTSNSQIISSRVTISKEKKRYDNSLHHPKDTTITNKKQHIKTYPQSIQSESMSTFPMKIGSSLPASRDKAPNESKESPSNIKSRRNHSSYDIQPSAPMLPNTLDKSTLKKSHRDVPPSSLHDATSASRDSGINSSLCPTVRPTRDADNDQVPLQTAKRRRFIAPSPKDSSLADTNKKIHRHLPSEPSNSGSSRSTIAESPRNSLWDASRESSSIVDLSPQISPSNSPLHKNHKEVVSADERWNALPNKGSSPIMNSSSNSSRPNQTSQSTGNDCTIVPSIVQSAQVVTLPLNASSSTSPHTIDVSFNSNQPKSPSQSNSRAVLPPTIEMDQWNIPSPNNDNRETSPIRSSIANLYSKDKWSSSAIKNNSAITSPTVGQSQLNTQLSQEPTTMDVSSKDGRSNLQSKTQKKLGRISRGNVPSSPPVPIKIEPSSGDNQPATSSTPVTMGSTMKTPSSRFHSDQLSKLGSFPSTSATLSYIKEPSNNIQASSDSIKSSSNGVSRFRFQPPKTPSTRRIAAPTFGNGPSHMIWNAPPVPTVNTDKIHELLGISGSIPAPESTQLNASKIQDLLGINRPAPEPIDMSSITANTYPSIEIPPRPKSRPNKNNNALKRATAPPTIQVSTVRNQPPAIGCTSTNINQKQPGVNSPLFIGNKRKVFSLIDDGQIVIRSKPNRVVIKGVDGTSKAYGDPKDYDDAINGVYRAANPVYKRMMDRTQYLFFKQESGAVVTIGPVSKIQPLIHKFFLAR